MSPDRGGGCRLGGGWIHSCSCCAGCAIPAAPARPRRARAPTGRARSTSAGSAQGAPWGWSRRRVDGDTLDVRLPHSPLGQGAGPGTVNALQVAHGGDAGVACGGESGIVTGSMTPRSGRRSPPPTSRPDGVDLGRDLVAGPGWGAPRSAATPTRLPEYRQLQQTCPPAPESGESDTVAAAFASAAAPVGLNADN